MKNLLCKIRLHKWNWLKNENYLTTSAHTRLCARCLRKEEITFWFGTEMGLTVIDKGNVCK